MIDDDDDHRELFGLAAQTLGLQASVVTFKSGPQALQHLQLQLSPPVLILVDVKMPGMDGPSTVRNLRAVPALELVPIVMISTSDNLGDQRNAQLAGANSYVLKPLGHNSWLDTLSSLVSYWSTCDVRWRTRQIRY